MVEPLRHRQTKGAATDMPGLPPPRHIPTLPNSAGPVRDPQGPLRGRQRPSFGKLTKLEIRPDLERYRDRGLAARQRPRGRWPRASPDLVPLVGRYRTLVIKP